MQLLLAGSGLDRGPNSDSDSGADGDAVNTSQICLVASLVYPGDLLAAALVFLGAHGCLLGDSRLTACLLMDIFWVRSAPELLCLGSRCYLPLKTWPGGSHR